MAFISKVYFCIRISLLILRILLLIKLSSPKVTQSYFGAVDQITYLINS